MWKRIFLIALIAWGAHSGWKMRAVAHGPGIIAASAPEQSAVSNPAAFDYKGYRITPLAAFVVEARLLARENYLMGRESDLSKTDFGLGWGRMSDESVLKKIQFSHFNRFLSWRVQEFPIPQREIETSAANMHLIPADASVDEKIGQVRRGQVVRLQGYLVRADAGDGWHWVSSLSREDTGAGACELLYVQDVRVVL